MGMAGGGGEVCGMHIRRLSKLWDELAIPRCRLRVICVYLWQFVCCNLEMKHKNSHACTSVQPCDVSTASHVMSLYSFVENGGWIRVRDLINPGGNVLVHVQ